MLSKKARAVVSHLKKNNFHLNKLYERSLLNHLTKTYLKLKSWGNPESTALIGLCHSLYEECEGYPNPGLHISSRNIIKDIVGDKCEHLAYTFALCEYNGSIVSLAKLNRDYLVRQDTNEKIHLSKSDAMILTEVSAANMVEQMEYLFDRLEPGDLEKYLKPYLDSKKYLSDKSIDNINHLLSYAI